MTDGTENDGSAGWHDHRSGEMSMNAGDSELWLCHDGSIEILDYCDPPCDIWIPASACREIAETWLERFGGEAPEEADETVSEHEGCDDMTDVGEKGYVKGGLVRSLADELNRCADAIGDEWIPSKTQGPEGELDLCLEEAVRAVLATDLRVCALAVGGVSYNGRDAPLGKRVDDSLSALKSALGILVAACGGKQAVGGMLAAAEGGDEDAAVVDWDTDGGKTTMTYRDRGFTVTISRDGDDPLRMTLQGDSDRVPLGLMDSASRCWREHQGVSL